jgi:hypothetical protein
MRRFVSIFFLAGAAMAMPLLAADTKPPQPSNPSLTAAVNGVNDASARSNALKISTLDMAITLRGSIAETVITAPIPPTRVWKAISPLICPQAQL